MCQTEAVTIPLPHELSGTLDSSIELRAKESDDISVNVEMPCIRHLPCGCGCGCRCGCGWGCGAGLCK